MRKGLTPVHTRIAAEASRLVEITTGVLNEQKAAVEAANVQSRWTTFLLMGISLLSAVGMTLVVRRVSASLRRTAAALSAGAAQVASAAVQVSSASQSLAEGASEQAATLERNIGIQQRSEFYSARKFEQLPCCGCVGDPIASEIQFGQPCSG